MARYIDADLLHNKMEDLYEHHIEMRNYSADGAVADCLDMLDNTPTADVVEVKHGKWIGKNKSRSIYNDWYCSVCGTYENNTTNKNRLGKYCPECGAIMDGKKE